MLLLQFLLQLPNIILLLLSCTCYKEIRQCSLENILLFSNSSIKNITNNPNLITTIKPFKYNLNFLISGYLLLPIEWLMNGWNRLLSILFSNNYICLIPSVLAPPNFGLSWLPHWYNRLQFLTVISNLLQPHTIALQLEINFMIRF